MEQYLPLVVIMVIGLLLAADTHGMATMAGSQMQVRFFKMKAGLAGRRQNTTGRVVGVFLSASAGMAMAADAATEHPVGPAGLAGVLSFIGGVAGCILGIGVWRASFPGGRLGVVGRAVTSALARLPFRSAPKSSFPIKARSAKGWGKPADDGRVAKGRAKPPRAGSPAKGTGNPPGDGPVKN